MSDNIIRKKIYFFIFITLCIKTFAIENNLSDNSYAIYKDIFKILTPYKIAELTKIRLGNTLSDGGYIVSKELIATIDRCYTYGAGNDITFEENLGKINKNAIIKIFDHTVLYPQNISTNIEFKQEGISTIKEEKLNTFYNHLLENNDFDKKIMLKMDIEGSEWEIINQMDLTLLNKVIILVVELHWFSKAEKLSLYKNVLEKLNKVFTIYHLHGNNCAPILNINGKKFPDVLEVTYINNKYINNKEQYISTIPMNIDYGNCFPNDYILDLI